MLCVEQVAVSVAMASPSSLEEPPQADNIKLEIEISIENRVDDRQLLAAIGVIGGQHFIFIKEAITTSKDMESGQGAHNKQHWTTEEINLHQGNNTGAGASLRRHRFLVS